MRHTAMAALLPMLHSAWAQVPQCTNGLTTTPATATVYPNGRVEASFKAECNNVAWNGGFPDAFCGPGNYTLRDGDQVVSIDEAKWCIRPQAVQTDALVLVLIDTSNSIASKNSIQSCGPRGCLEYLQQAVVQFISTLQTNIPGAGNDLGIEVRIEAFDGRAGTQPVADWTTSRSALVNGINAVSCGSVYCQDPSTNLHGALADASTYLADRAIGRNVQHAFLVFFTDGTDQAHRLTADQAVARILNPVTSSGNAIGNTLPVLDVHGIGVTGEDKHANTGICEACFNQLTLNVPGHVHLTNSFTNLGTTFVNAANMIRVMSQSYYAVHYCTPRRSGTNNRLTLQYHGALATGLGFANTEIPIATYDATSLGATATDNVVGCEAEICTCTPAPTMYCPEPCIHPYTISESCRQTGHQRGEPIVGYPLFPGANPVPVPVPVPVSMPGTPGTVPVPVPGPPVPVPVPVGVPVPIGSTPCTPTVRYVERPASPGTVYVAPGGTPAPTSACDCKDEKDERDNWMIVGIVFIIIAALLFLVAVGLLAALMGAKKKLKQERQERAAQQAYLQPSQSFGHGGDFGSPPQHEKSEMAPAVSPPQPQYGDQQTYGDYSYSAPGQDHTYSQTGQSETRQD